MLDRVGALSQLLHPPRPKKTERTRTLTVPRSDPQTRAVFLADAQWTNEFTRSAKQLLINFYHVISSSTKVSTICVLAWTTYKFGVQDKVYKDKCKNLIGTGFWGLSFSLDQEGMTNHVLWLCNLLINSHNSISRYSWSMLFSCVCLFSFVWSLLIICLWQSIKYHPIQNLQSP